MRFRPDQITPFGLEPYAVYGGVVYSFKCPSVSGDRIYDASLLERILAASQERANGLIAERNARNV